MKPIIFNELVRIAEVDGEPVAFMLTIPDINELTADLNGELFPFNLIKLLWRLRKPRTRRLRVPLMGVAKKLHHTPPREPARLHDDRISPAATRSRKYGATHGEFGWILEDNKGMLSIAELPERGGQPPLPDLREGALAPRRAQRSPQASIAASPAPRNDG